MAKKSKTKTSKTKKLKMKKLKSKPQLKKHTKANPKPHVPTPPQPPSAGSTFFDTKSDTSDLIKR
jgi:hypothetical protein